MDPEVIFREYDHRFILDLIADKKEFELKLARMVFSDRPDFWADTVKALDNIITAEKDRYEQRYHVRFEEAEPLLSDLEKAVEGQRQRTGHADQLFKRPEPHDMGST